jgi:NAD-dependent deacetylase
MSQESGIPTFRESLVGYWAKFDPAELATPDAFARNPKLVWDWYATRTARVSEVAPHAGHLAVAQLIARQPQSLLVTQNVDGLHQRAALELGFEQTGQIEELHGSLLRTLCHRTLKAVDSSWLQQHAELSPIPSPHHAEGWCRPGVVWFGEALPQAAWQRAEAAAASADVVLIIGTSGLVQPAASLPLMAKRSGAFVIEINPMRSELTPLADVWFAGSAREWLPNLATTD